MNYRFFVVTDGPVMDCFLTLVVQRAIAAKAIRKFMKEVGAAECYGSDPSNYLFDFKTPSAVDKNLWAKTKPRRGTYYFRPAKTPAGKLIAQQIKSLPAAPELNRCIEEAGLIRIPAMVEGHHWYAPHLRFYSKDDKTLVVQVPWRDVDPKEMAKYKKDKNWRSMEMEYLQWTPPESFKEVKEWEALKLMEELLARDTK